MNWRIGAVSYLNTKPLIYSLQRHLPACRLELDLPSRLADRLEAGDLDVALIPSVEYFRSRRGRIVSNACIACRGPVWSVQVWFRTEPSKTRTLALDEGSRTSAALIQILLQQRFAIRPQLQTLPIGAEPQSSTADAVLVIGDRAIAPAPSEFQFTWDLGDHWCRHTELPFVFAMWVARSEPIAADIGWALQASRDDGLNQLEEIAADFAPQYNLLTADCLRYLRDYLYFYLGQQEIKGLELFYKSAVALGLVSQGRSLPFMQVSQ